MPNPGDHRDADVKKTCPRCKHLTAQQSICPNCWTVLDVPETYLIRTTTGPRNAPKRIKRPRNACSSARRLVSKNIRAPRAGGHR